MPAREWNVARSRKFRTPLASGTPTCRGNSFGCVSQPGRRPPPRGRPRWGAGQGKLSALSRARRMLRMPPVGEGRADTGSVYSIRRKNRWIDARPRSRGLRPAARPLVRAMPVYRTDSGPSRKGADHCAEWVAPATRIFSGAAQTGRKPPPAQRACGRNSAHQRSENCGWRRFRWKLLPRGRIAG